MRVPTYSKLPARFWRKVKAQNGCLVWTGSRLPTGYGRFYIDEKVKLAHRLVAEEILGEIPDGSVVLHSCDNPPCVSRDHLSYGTQGENMKEMVERGRSNGGAPTGRDNHNSKLTVRRVRLARRLVEAGEATGVELAQRFGVSKQAMNAAISGKTWGDV